MGFSWSLSVTAEEQYQLLLFMAMTFKTGEQINISNEGFWCSFYEHAWLHNDQIAAHALNSERYGEFWVKNVNLDITPWLTDTFYNYSSGDFIHYNHARLLN